MGLSMYPIEPKPVHPRRVESHGLLGYPYLRQHMMSDGRWSTNSLTEQFASMSQMLSRRNRFKKLVSDAHRIKHVKEKRSLFHLCQNGRRKLHHIKVENNSKVVRNILINHKGMQRLYQNMPLPLVKNNIDQRTFVMRKERDRLHYRMRQLMDAYRVKVVQRGELEIRVKYEDSFIPEEEIKSRAIPKKIENSKIRLRAFKIINNTYKKMIEVLNNDEIFYEPILHSLSRDLDDQAQFIEHVLFLGKPAIAKFSELNTEFKAEITKARKSISSKIQIISNFQKLERSSLNKATKVRKSNNGTEGRYVRETKSMQDLKQEVEDTEEIIKTIQYTTLCSRAKEIFPRIRHQIENNTKLQKIIAKDMLSHDAFQMKMKNCKVLRGVLVHSLTDEETKRLDRIKELKEALIEEDRIQEESISYMTNRANTYVLLRISIWNIYDILRHVGKPAGNVRAKYPNSYLNLPLLKFEMLTMSAVMPTLYEEDIEIVLHETQKKLNDLMNVFNKAKLTPEVMESHQNEAFTVIQEGLYDARESLAENQAMEPQDDEIIDAKVLENIPTRKQLKSKSLKMVEELSKKED